MVGHGGSSAGSYLADPTSPIPSHCAVIIYPVSKCRSASIVVTSTVRVNQHKAQTQEPVHSVVISYKRALSAGDDIYTALGAV